MEPAGGLYSLHTVSRRFPGAQLATLCRHADIRARAGTVWCRTGFRHPGHPLYQRGYSAHVPAAAALEGTSRLLPRGAMDLHHREQYCGVYEPDGLRLFPLHGQAHHGLGVRRVQQRGHGRNAEDFRRAVPEPLVPGAAGSAGDLGLLETVQTFWERISRRKRT